MNSMLPPDSNPISRHDYEQIAQLAGGLAHELRNPLSTMCLNLEILKDELAGSETVRDRRMRQRLDSIHRECDRLQELLQDFLQFARGLELTFEPVDLNALVCEFVEFQTPRANAQQVELSSHLQTDLPHIQLDAKQFRSVLTNLTINALQAMPAGGRLEFLTYLHEGNVVLEVIDSGEGISEKRIAKIFDLFFSSKPGGSGLGLPTVRKIIEAHRGSIDCESEPGRGTRFRIVLPVGPEDT